jgi:hypothetical protein
MCDSRGLVCRERHSFCFGVVHNNSLRGHEKLAVVYLPSRYASRFQTFGTTVHSASGEFSAHNRHRAFSV